MTRERPRQIYTSSVKRSQRGRRQALKALVVVLVVAATIAVVVLT